MAENKIPPVTGPGVDIAELLRFLIGDTGSLVESMGGFRVKIYHTRAFPWDAVFRELLYRDFKTYVTHHKADIFIEAAP